MYILTNNLASRTHDKVREYVGSNYSLMLRKQINIQAIKRYRLL
jgi:hypothetical protein